MPVAAPWLNPPDIAQEYSKGLQIGASIGQEQARLQAEHERTVMESEARAQTAKQTAELAKARIATESAYRTATIGLQQQRLQDAAAVNAQKTKDAALKMADQQGFAEDLKNGMKIEDALYRHPRMATPAAAVAAHKDTLDLGTQRLDLREREQAMRERALTDRENKTPPPRRTGFRTTKGPGEGETQTTYTFEGDQPPQPPGGPVAPPKVPVGPSGAPMVTNAAPWQAGSAGGPPQPKTQSEYDALAPGTMYLKLDGTPHTKKGKGDARSSD